MAQVMMADDGVSGTHLLAAPAPDAVDESLGAITCASVAQNEWAERFTNRVAETVRYYRRDVRNMSAQKLADACAALGHPIPRSVLANFEAGRRPMLTVAELLVLAKALDVPPVLLLLPVGQAATVEAVPGQVVSPPRALDWVTGASTLEGDDPAPGFLSVINDQAGHERLERHMLELVQALKESGEDADLPSARGTYFDLADMHRDLWHTRRRMEARGEVLPALDPALDWVDTLKPAGMRVNELEHLPRGLRVGDRKPWEAAS